MMTREEMEEKKTETGVRDPDTNYNILHNGMGTGMAPPTDDEWEAMVGTPVLDSVISTRALPPSLDHSTESSFPPVGNQGGQGSCSAWSTNYYQNTYYQAKDNGWDFTGDSWEYIWSTKEIYFTGDDSTVMSASWTYNKCNEGVDGGSHFWGNYDVIQFAGSATQNTQPYSGIINGAGDYTSWGTESAWREAPLYRASSSSTTIWSPFDDSDVTSVKTAIYDGYLVSFSINTASYNSGLGNGDDTISSGEVVSGSNHAQTVVGYDDTWSSDGETGAFKIVNSWGNDWGETSSYEGDWNGAGFYWMTYDAFKLMENHAMFYQDIPDYEPELLGVWEMNPVGDRSADFELGIGTKSSPYDSRYPGPYWDGGTYDFPAFMCLDITEFVDDWGSSSSFYLDMGSGSSSTEIDTFTVEDYTSPYTPGSPIRTSPSSPDCPDTNSCTVYTTFNPRDLEADSVSGDATGTAGGTVDVTRAFSNNGPLSTGSFTYRLYLSTDTTITDGSDIQLYSTTVSSVSGRGTNSDTVTVSIPGGTSSGTYYYGLIVDVGDTVTESPEDNNAVASLSTMTVGSVADTTPPNIDITSPGDNDWSTSSSVTVSWTGSDSESGIKRYDAKLDGGSYYSVGTSTSETFNSLSEGSHTVYIRAVDNADNTAVDSVTFSVDTVDPSVDVGGTVSENSQFSKNAVTSDTGGSGIASWQWSKQSGTGTISFTAPTSEDTSISSNNDDSFVIRLTVTDNAGNSAYDELTLIWDTAAPSVDAGDAIAENSAFLRDATTSDGSGSGITSWQWSKQSGTGTVNFGTPTLEDTTIDALSENTYTIRLTVTDNAGNSAYDEFTLTWDTTAPSVEAGSAVTENGQFTQDATASDTGGSGIDSHLWSKFSGPGDLDFGTPALEDTTVSATQDGTYTVRLTVTDNAGNSAHDDFTLVWDTVAPSVDVGGPVSTSSQFSKDAVTSDTGGSGMASWQWSKESGSGTISFGTPTLEDTTISAGTDDTYVIRLTVTDNAGNSAYDEFTLTWASSAPSVDVGDDVIANGQFTKDATTSDNSGTGLDSWQWSKESGTGTINFGTPALEDTTISASADGTYTIRLTVTDNAANSAYAEFTLTWDTTAPSVEAGSAVTENGQFTQDATASDTGGSGIESYAWSKFNGPGDLNFGTPALEDTTVSATQDGTYTVRLTVTDNAGNSDHDDFTLVWDTSAPSVDVGDAVAASSQITKNAHTSDGTGSGIATWQWSKQSGSGTVNFGTPTLEDTTIDALSENTYTIRLTVTDNAGNSAYDQFTLTWDTTAPSVEAGSAVTENGQFTQDATASDTGGSGIESYAWSKFSGPGDLDFGTPALEDTTVSATQDGTYTVRLTVTDNAGNSAYDDFTLVWDTVAPSVDVGGSVSTSSQFSKDAVTSDTGGSGMASWQWSKASGSGTISFGTPTLEDTTISAGTDDTYLIRLTVTDNAGNSAHDDFTLIWDTTAPLVDAGNPTAENSQFTRVGSATDTGGSGVASYSWSKASGTGTIVFGSPSSATTTISSSAQGTFTIRLTATDNVGNTAYDEFILTWDITPPSVEAGLPQNRQSIFTQDATAFDTGGSGIGSYLWSKQSGPGTVSFGTPNAEDTTVSATDEGEYVIRLTVTDNAGNSAFDEFTLIWDGTAPEVNVGGDVVTNTQFSKDATVTDGGSGISFYSWTKQSGPGTVNFGAAASEDTTISATEDGTYVIRLTVEDVSGNSGHGEFNLIWDTTSPSVDAGEDIAASSQFSRDATITETGSGPATYGWSKVSGPGAITFGTPTSKDTTISAATDGSYVIRLTVTDNAGNEGQGSFLLTWDTTAPVVDAGEDATVNSQHLQDATVTDPGSGIASYSWSKVSGPGTITFGSPTSEDTTLDATLDGVYTVRLAVVDAAGNTNHDDAIFTLDTTGPEVSSTSPEDGSTGVAVNTTVTIQFNEKVDTDSVELALGIEPYASVEDFQWTDGEQLVLVFDLDLYPDNTYTITIAKSAADVLGNQMVTSFSFSFTTGYDLDDDGIPDSIDPDDDGDGVDDEDDDFPANPSEWSDTDEDGTGDNADTDDDDDGVDDTDDVFPLDPQEWTDTDDDGVGNNADDDDDGDGVMDWEDDLPLDKDETEDLDGDGIGNNADPDDDGDKIADTLDEFPDDPDEYVDTDGDGTGNNADPDDDGDGVLDVDDPFPQDGNEWLDTDGDGIGDNSDPDDDNDGTDDTLDSFPLDPTEHRDTDGDGFGDFVDKDDDGDGVTDDNDDFPLDSSEQLDSNGDGVGDNADDDDDGDGIPDLSDPFPMDPEEWSDSDGDGLGDNQDNDDDGDGVPDTMDMFPLDPKRSELIDTDDDDGSGDDGTDSSWSDDDQGDDHWDVTDGDDGNGAEDNGDSQDEDVVGEDADEEGGSSDTDSLLSGNMLWVVVVLILVALVGGFLAMAFLGKSKK